jgi:cell division protease FtsH
VHAEVFLLLEDDNKRKDDKRHVNSRGPSGQKDSGGGNKKKPDKKLNSSKTILMWLFVAILVIVGLQFSAGFDSFRETKITYSQFTKLLELAPNSIQNAVVTLKGFNRADLHGELVDQSVMSQIPGTPPMQSNKFVVHLPFIDSDMIESWDEAGLKYSFEPEKMNFGEIFISLLPWILMILFWVFMIRQMQSGQKGIFSFGKSRAKITSMDRPKNTFADAAGVEEAKAELQEIIEFLKDPEKFRKLGGKIPKGVLLLGPPGTGKTLLARCVAGEAGVPFLSISGSDFVEMFVGVGASRVRDLFETAKRNSPCIVFIDEIDAVGRQRGAGLGGGHDEREQTLNQLLVEMDGFEENSGVILIAATNRPDVLDPALLRPGRFDRQIVVDMPDIKGREGILKVHAKNIPLDDDVDFTTIARGTPGFVGADIANLINEAALMAARYGQSKVTMLDIEEAKDKVLMGVERKSMVLSDEEKKTTAYHEAGHTICNVYCDEADPLHKVTIIPRGRALGVTFSLPGEDKHSYSKNYLLDRICIMMGGRVAEELVFSIQTTGAANDIRQATDLVRKLVCDYGMSDQLGPLSYGEKDEQIFLGREFNRHRDFSEKTAEEIDQLMREIIIHQYNRAKKILVEHHDELDRLAQALIDHECLDLEEVKKVIAGDILEITKKRSVINSRKQNLKDAEKQKETTSEAATTGVSAESDAEKDADTTSPKN